MTGLKFSVKNEILRVSFHKPSAGNSFGIDDAVALTKALKTYRKMRGLLWTSDHPRLFCAGGDLKHHAKLKTKKQGLAESKKIAAALQALADMPVPKAAMVNGDCFGGGMELLSCFNHRVAAPHVLFGFWQRRIGLSFGWGGYRRWLTSLAPGAVKELAFTARIFGSSEALRIGVIDSIGAAPEAESWLLQTRRWSELSGESLSALDDKSERRIFEHLWWIEDHLDSIQDFGLASVQGKRPEFRKRS